MLSYYALIGTAVLAYTSLWYLYGQRVGRLDVADEAWGLAQPFIALVAMVLARNYTTNSILLFLLTLVWGYRLFDHLHKRHAKSVDDDARYVKMKAGWKKYPKLQAYVIVFLLQGLLMYLLGVASMVLVSDGAWWNSFSVIGLTIWMAGFIFEVTADRQLRDFVANPENKGHIMDKGLWKYSRHPNYFGEVIMWWGIFFFVLINTGSIWAIVTPLTITYLIVFVSGIPMTEKLFENSPLWNTYKNKTSVLIPWPNKK